MLIRETDIAHYENFTIMERLYASDDYDDVHEWENNGLDERSISFWFDGEERKYFCKTIYPKYHPYNQSNFKSKLHEIYLKNRKCSLPDKYPLLAQSLTKAANDGYNKYIIELTKEEMDYLKSEGFTVNVRHHGIVKEMCVIEW